MPRRRRAVRRDLALAAAISVAVHAALLVLLVRARPAGEGGALMAVELVTLPPPNEPTPTATPTPTPTATPTSTPTPTPTATPTPTPTPTAPAPPSAPSPSGTPRAPGPAAAWLRDQGLLRPPAPAAPRALVTPVPRELVPPAADPTREANEVISDFTASARAGDLARHPDASWMDLRDQLLRGFEPGFDVLGEAGGEGLAGFLANAARAYAATAGRYGAAGSPYLPDPGAPGRRGAAKDAAARAGAAGSRERAELRAALDALGAGAGAAGPEAWTRRLVTTIAVELDAAGRVSAARVARRSGSDAHDRLALAQATRLVGELAAARLASTTTEWCFVTDFSVVPPVPALGLSFDANFRPTGAVYPLKRTTRTEVSLVAVRRTG